MCPALGHDGQLGADDLVVHVARQRWVALVVVADGDQRRDMNARKAIAIFDGLEIAVDDEFSV